MITAAASLVLLITGAMDVANCINRCGNKHLKRTRGPVSIWNERFNDSVPEERTVPERRRRCYRTVPNRRQQTSNRGHMRESAIADEPTFDSWSLGIRGRKT
ncbi:hypothetical protein GBA52_015093 [Prunus armeniaca]|nr:hypothetical protein GBA52_015093 [Prunus armeniaca]